MSVVLSDSDSNLNSDIYELEANDNIPLAVYILNSESENEEEENVMTETNPDIYVLLLDYLFRSDSHHDVGHGAKMDGQVPNTETEEGLPLCLNIFLIDILLIPLLIFRMSDWNSKNTCVILSLYLFSR